MLLAGRSCGLYVSRGAQGERVSGWKRDSDRWIQFAASMKMNRSELQINHIVSCAGGGGVIGHRTQQLVKDGWVL